jgi:acetate kinase
MKIFVINCGSSSLKYKLYSMTHEKVLASGLVERIGQDDARLHHRVGSGEIQLSDIEAPDHHVAIARVLDRLVESGGAIKTVREIVGVGHRVVHAGEKYSDSVRIDDAVIRVIEDYFDLSPLHNPPNLTGIRAAMKAMPEVPHIAVFDTAFFATMPKRAWMYAVPLEWYEKYRIRKYGFHGTSHRYVTYQSGKLMGKPLDQINLITCHLGNGCSMTAVAGGKAIEHSMGMTPLAGLVMGTRSGDIDPAVVFYLIATAGMSVEEVSTQLNKNSGLLGVSGVSNDMRDCEAAAAKGDERAKLALELFRYRIIRYIGSYHAVLPRLDGIVFTGGIGENSYMTRRAVCHGLSSLGIELDDAANDKTRRGAEGVITQPTSKIPVWVVPTDEELMIARDTLKIVNEQ